MRQEADGLPVATAAFTVVGPSTVYRSALADVPGDRLRIGFGRRMLDAPADRLAEWLAAQPEP